VCKYILIILGCVSLLMSVSTRAAGFLKADGQFIVNEQGEKVLLRGMGLGGWMLQEGYMLKLNEVGQQYRIQQKIEDLIGASATNEFYRVWRANHTTKADIDALARWGFNSVRLPMHYNLYTLPVEKEPVKGKQTWLTEGFAMTDALLAWCKANNMYLILDLHATPGGQGNDVAISDRDPSKPSLWESKANQEKMIALWRKLAQRYANEPMVAAYDIINEPNWGFESIDDKNGCKEKFNKPLRELMVKVTKAIREVDSKHMVIAEGNCWGNNYQGVMPVWDNNLVLSFHKYWNNNKDAELGGILKLRSENNIPVWLGESGENSNLWHADAIRLVESHGIGWAFWPLKKIGFNNPLQVQPNAGYARVLNYFKGEGERPTRAAATQALMQLAQQDIRFQNNLFHPDVIDAMFRQPHSTTSIPFSSNIINKNGGIIKAVNYDMGVHSYADNDSANYYISTGGERQPWNRGNVYRNDGVDIYEDKNAPEQYIVGNIEAGEWLEYTITAEQAGTYNLSVLVAGDESSAALEVLLNNSLAGAATIVLGKTWQEQQLLSVNLQEGNNHLRIITRAGTYQFANLKFITVN
jgi:endoglucanase